MKLNIAAALQAQREENGFDWLSRGVLFLGALASGACFGYTAALKEIGAPYVVGPLLLPLYCAALGLVILSLAIGGYAGLYDKSARRRAGQSIIDGAAEEV